MSISKKVTQEAALPIKSVDASSHTKVAEFQKKPTSHTKIVVKCNCGFPNNLFLRGEGIPGLTWDKGVLLKCTKVDEWVWESDAPFKNAKFKIVLNDKQYEIGDNHSIDCGKSILFIPNF